MVDNNQVFSVSSPLQGLKIDTDIQLFDVHVHLHNKSFSEEFLTTLQKYNITHIQGITGPKVKKYFDRQQLSENVSFCYFLSIFDFLRYKTKKLVKQVHKAKELDFSSIKIFFGPRMWQFSRRKEYYKINDAKILPVYDAIAEHNFPVLIHVADPDLWYQRRYTNVNKYGTKEDRINDFIDLLEMYPTIKWISAHFGSLPENLPKLGTLFDTYPNLYVDTGSTKWMIRELGKNVTETKEFLARYQDRVLWGSDIANRVGIRSSKSKREFYWYSRFWSHRLFWETPFEAPLAFKDSDNPEGTNIHGLDLPLNILNKIYFTNAQKLLSKP